MGVQVNEFGGHNLRVIPTIGGISLGERVPCCDAVDNGRYFAFCCDFCYDFSNVINLTSMRKTFFTVYIEQDEDGMFVGSIPSVPSCYADGKTQKEMLKNLDQVLKLCLRNTNTRRFAKSKFIGIQTVEAVYA